ncbi:MAG: UDP-N-acetylmuramoylalanyl-D-glutamyl-2, 6-diaminopimelate--D-alanyl-D-alanine ligase [Desulfuromonadales bacterium C00003107]|nr:MAG: UDP-N-acetylmuramoylalanyl-D-glutamyl-2, 6-diaminopimelate--D-alanyl-D-alanine ligase [Desulfuromonadales bacterium C00003107]
MKLDFQSVVQITAGSLTPSKAQGSISGISTDSRSTQPGDLFIPLRGPNFDGHDFLLQAARNGAVACLSEEVISGFPVPIIRVKDALQALGDLAGARRQAFTGPVVAVTGSAGKTTTKEMLGAILGLTGPGLITPGNFNNLVGLPQTLFTLGEEHRWAVLEMGMSALGEIARLAEIAQPHIGVITNIGAAHLETLRGLDGVARAKGELFAALPPEGTAVINADDSRVLALPVANGAQRLLFGCSEQATVRAEQIDQWEGGVSFQLHLPDGNYRVKLHAWGRYNVHNALAAAAAAHALLVPGPVIVHGLELFRPCAGRMEATTLADGVLLLEDCYNANPQAVKAALETLAELPGQGRNVAVLGDMLELGEAAAQLHREVGQVAAGCVDELLLLGDFASETAAAARHAGLNKKQVTIATDHQDLVGRLLQIVQPGDRVLIKGSRGMAMEKICAALKAGHPQQAVGH